MPGGRWLLVVRPAWVICALLTVLVSLSDELVGVVRETMQPEHASLWLRRPEDSP